jgi:polar amino acid transport system substrate-binding protein
MTGFLSESTMKIKAPRIIVLAMVIAMTLVSGNVHPAERTLTVITYPFEPYIFPSESDLKGIDYEITEAVFKKLNIPVRIMYYPWKRCLVMMMNREADAIIDLLATDERKGYLHFPDEPISINSLVVFRRKGNDLNIKSLRDLKNYVVGTQLGWEYPKELDAVLVNREEARSMEQNVRKLVTDRVDIMVENNIVGLYTAKIAGVSEQVELLELPEQFTSRYYVGFSKKSGYENLARKFSDALKEFKKTKEYSDILRKYGQI